MQFARGSKTASFRARVPLVKHAGGGWGLIHMQLLPPTNATSAAVVGSKTPSAMLMVPTSTAKTALQEELETGITVQKDGTQGIVAAAAGRRMLRMRWPFFS